MKLYGSYTSPFVRHCRVALAQEGFDFEFVEADSALSAERSPTSKVPFFSEGAVQLTDSSSILKYLREKAGRVFLADIDDYENFTMVNTTLDSAINLFLLENEGFGAEQINYLARQKARITSGLKALNERLTPDHSMEQDGALRCACFLDWGLFRQRIRLDGLRNLDGLLANAKQVDAFAATAPPR